MSDDPKELKLLPCGAFKGQVFEMYPRTPDGTLRDTMLYCQKIVYPHLPEKKLKNAQWLSRLVIEEIIKYEGPPAGYQSKFKK